MRTIRIRKNIRCRTGNGRCERLGYGFVPESVDSPRAKDAGAVMLAGRRAHGFTFVHTIVALAPGVTSRERLALAEEAVLMLDGLPCAGSQDGAALLDATRLFVERARQVRADFDPGLEGDRIAEL